MSATTTEATTQAVATSLPQAGTPTSTPTPSATTPPQAGSGGGKKDELEELSPAELARIVKDLRKENATARTKLTTFEQEEQKRKDAELSEIERRDKRIAELEATGVAAQQKEREYALRDAIGEQLGTKDFPQTLAPGVTPAKLLRLIDGAAVQYDAAGQPTNVKALLSGLARSDAYLFAARRVPSADGGAGREGAVGGTMNDEIRAAWRGGQ